MLCPYCCLEGKKEELVVSLHNAMYCSHCRIEFTDGELKKIGLLLNTLDRVTSALEAVVAIIGKRAVKIDSSGMGGGLWMHKFGDAKQELRRAKKLLEKYVRPDYMKGEA